MGSDWHRADDKGIGKAIDTGSMGKHLAQGGGERNRLRANVKVCIHTRLCRFESVYPYKANGQLHTNTGSLKILCIDKDR